MPLELALSWIVPDSGTSLDVMLMGLAFAPISTTKSFHLLVAQSPRLPHGVANHGAISDA